MRCVRNVNSIHWNQIAIIMLCPRWVVCLCREYVYFICSTRISVKIGRLFRTSIHTHTHTDAFTRVNVLHIMNHAHTHTPHVVCSLVVWLLLPLRYGNPKTDTLLDRICDAVCACVWMWVGFLLICHRDRADGWINIIHIHSLTHSADDRSLTLTNMSINNKHVSCGARERE